MTNQTELPRLAELMSKKETSLLVGLSLPTLWRLQRAGHFPRLRQVSPGRVAWLRREVEEWIRNRPVVA